MNISNKTLKFISKYFLLFADIFLIVIMGIYNPRFLQIRNLLDIAATASLIGIMGMGASVVMMVGELNFGFGTEATLIAALLGWSLGAEILQSYMLALLASIVCAAIIGLTNSFFAVKLGVPAFIATLALSRVWDAAINYVNNGKTMYYLNWPKAFSVLGQGYVGPVPVSVIAFAAISIAMWFVIDKTKLGKYIQAIGNNANCCRQVGINVKKIKVIAFILCSVICAFSGIMAASKTGSVSVTLGSSMTLNAISSAMLSATFLRPGRYNVQGTVVAAFLMAIIQNSCTFCGFPLAIQDLCNGACLIIAVAYIASTREGGLPSVKVG